MKQTKVVSYGAGTNSTAMLVGLYERSDRPDAILFADTGGERPETYSHLAIVSDWCLSIGFPEIKIIRASGKTLEEDCLDRKALPSIAYGFKTCSLRWKKDPQDKWLRNNGMSDATRLIGIDADEIRRAKDFPNTKYPLIEWDWGRDECVDAINRAGLSQPGKSACFFCPSSKPKEIVSLGISHPELLQRALKMEMNAELTSIKGLGRSFSWSDIAIAHNSQSDLFKVVQEIPCGCFDG